METISMFAAAVILVLNAYPNDPRSVQEICREKIEMKVPDTNPPEDFYWAREACDYILYQHVEEPQS